MHCSYILCICMYYLYKGLIFLMDHLYYVHSMQYIHASFYSCTFLLLQELLKKEEKSVSILTYTAESKHNGLNMTCKAYNQKIHYDYVEDSVPIVVHCKQRWVSGYLDIRLLRYPNTRLSRPFFLSKCPDTKSIEVSNYPSIR